MSFKFNLRQRVVMPGASSIQGVVIGRGEDTLSEPIYRVAWVDDSAEVQTSSFTEASLTVAQPKAKR